MKIKKIIDKLTVVDELYTDKEIEIMDNWFGSYTMWGLGYDELDYGASTATLCRSLKWDQWVGYHHMLDDMQNIMRERLGEKGIDVPYFGRCLINNFKFGDTPLFHKDAPGTPNSQTFMVYPNRCWNKNWGGFTAFADNDDDVIAVAAPKPGRIAIFPGDVSHTGVAPTKVHQGYGRFSVAFQDPDGFPKPEDRKTVKPEDVEKTSLVAHYGDTHSRLL